MTAQGASLRNPRSGNGRTAAENAAYAAMASNARSRGQQLAAVDRMNAGRREHARQRIIERDGPQPDKIMPRLIDIEIKRQMAAARAAALTARRKAREADERLAAAEAELLDATGLDNAGEQR